MLFTKIKFLCIFNQSLKQCRFWLAGFSENFEVCCSFRCILHYFWSRIHTLWTQIRLLLMEQSDLGPYCLQYGDTWTLAFMYQSKEGQGPVAQSVVSLTPDPGVESSIPTRSYTFMEIDHEIISTVILLLLFQKWALSSLETLVTLHCYSSVTEWVMPGLQLQLMAQFRIWPSSESRHSFVANYTSVVIFKIHISVLFCCIIIPLYVSESKYL